MTRVDFYIVDQDSADARLPVACRIAEKAFLKEQRVFVATESQAESERLDDLLWTFSQGSFVPHRVITRPTDDNFSEPVQIGHAVSFDAGSFDLIINLTAEVPEAYANCQRIAELIDGNSTRRAQGRERFRYYRDHGIEPNTHHV